MTRPRSLNFVQKITLLVAMTLIITGLINWAAGDVVFYQTMREEAFMANRRAAETLARRLEDLLLSGTNLLGLLAHDSQVAWEDPRGVQVALEKFRDQGGLFDGLSFVAADGRLMAIDPLDQAVIGRDLSGRDYVRQVLDGRRAYVSDAFLALTGRLIVVVAVPVTDERGRRIGVLSGSMNLRTNNNLSRLISGVNLGQGGYVVVVDRRGRVLYHPDSSFLMKDLSDNPAVREVLSGREHIAEGVDEHGQKVLVAFSPVRNAGWGVIARIPEAQFLMPLWRFNVQTLVVSLLTLLGAVGLGLLIAKRLVRPLHDLVSALRAVSRGDFNVQVPVRSRDEWGVLAAAFNRMVAELSSYHRELEARATRDPLTGVYNRGYFEERLALEMRWAHLAGTPLSLLMIDIDNFKAYNDTFGHPAGDEVLVVCASLFSEAVRDADLVARYGGEEFAVILPNADCAVAEEVAERVRRAVEAYPFLHRQVTISVGAACYPQHGEDAASLVASADAALYQAKGTGKNRVVIAA